MSKFKFSSLLGDISKKNVIYILGAIGIVFLAISALSSDEEPKKANEDKPVDYCEELESRLEKILPEIINVGKVDVMVTAKNYGRVIPAKNEGAADNDIIILNQKGGGEDIKIIEEIYPSIQGVIVVATGGKSDKVKTNLTEAITALLCVEAHKIKIFERKIE